MQIGLNRNDISDEKSASAPIWSIFRPESFEFVKQSPLFPKETGEVLDATYAEPFDASDRLRMHRRPGGSQIFASDHWECFKPSLHDVAPGGAPVRILT